jgi:sec-independent protein translocase protein TatA
MNLGSTELIIVLVIVLLVFGGSQLPKLAKNLGKAQKEFKQGLDEGKKDEAESGSGSTASSE